MTLHPTSTSITDKILTNLQESCVLLEHLESVQESKESSYALALAQLHELLRQAVHQVGVLQPPHVFYALAELPPSTPALSCPLPQSS